MGLKKICTEFAIFDEDDPNNDFSALLKENLDKFPQSAGNDEDQTGGISRDKGNNVRDLITAFTICNNITPLFKDPTLDKALGDLDYNRVSLIGGHEESMMMRNSPDRTQVRGTYQPGQSTVIQIIDSNREPRPSAKLDRKQLSKISGREGKRVG
jgi:hypothetical protein